MDNSSKSDKKVSVKRLLKYVGKCISILSIIFIVYAVYNLGFDFSSITNIPSFIGIIIISIILKTITVYIMGMAWTRWLTFFSKTKCKVAEALCVYAKANIGKYLPGNVMHYVERNLFASKMGIEQKKIAISSILEVLGLVSVAGIISISISVGQLSDALYNVLGENYIIIISIAICIGIVGLVAIILVFRKKFMEIISEYSIKDFIKTFAINLVFYAIVLSTLGFIMVLLFGYMGGTINLSNFKLIITGYIIAWVLGFVVPGAPGGIGVRELVISVLLGPIVGEQLMLTLSITHRLITIIGDFCAYVIRYIIQAVMKKRDMKNQ